MNTFHYSGQIRRFLIQFIRAMSGFQVEISKDNQGVVAYQQIPVIYGDSSRQVAQIIRGNSENSLPTVPAMSITISGLKYDRVRILNPYHVNKIQMKERHYDTTTNEWTTDRGDSFVVERLMPAPYTLSLKLDIWSSSTEQKLQIIEQIVTLFNPELEVQSTDNYVDWTSLSAIFLSDTTWTSRNVPMGADESIDVATFTFDLPIWLGSPAKVKKLGVIQKMITNIYDETGNMSPSIVDSMNDTLMTRSVITPLNAQVLYLGNTLQLLKATDIVMPDGSIKLTNTVGPASWQQLIDMYGQLTNGTTQIRLYQEGTGTEIVGTVAYHPADPLLLLYTTFNDTLPTNTITAINSIVDPFTVKLTAAILSPATGYRILILNNIGSVTNDEGATAWRGSDNVDLVAKKNDIIEFNGSHWIVSFAAADETEIKYVSNLSSGTQFKFENKQWVKSVEGLYTNGNWRIVL